MAQRLVAEYADAAAFIEAAETELVYGGLLVRGAQPTAGSRDCLLVVCLAGDVIAEVACHIGSVARFGATVVFDEPPQFLLDLANGLKAPPEPIQEPEPVAEPEPVLEPELLLVPAPDYDADTEPVLKDGASDESAPSPRNAAERLASLTVAQKIAQATSGDRETRIALLRDHNKMLHAYVFRNPRLQLDEVLVAAKMNTLSPEALKVIAEHKEWGQNLTVCTALVRNPKTPTPVALRLLPRLPLGDVRAIAKGGAKDQLVAAARKMLAG